MAGGFPQEQTPSFNAYKIITNSYTLQRGAPNKYTQKKPYFLISINTITVLHD